MSSQNLVFFFNSLTVEKTVETTVEKTVESEIRKKKLWLGNGISQSPQKGELGGQNLVCQVVRATG